MQDLPDIDVRALFGEPPAMPDFVPTLDVNDGTIFVTCKEGHRLSLSTTIERLIDMLDALDPDADVEDNGDLEPSLSWPERGPQTLRFTDTEDQELDDADCEPSLGSINPRLGSIESPWGRSGILTRDYSCSQVAWASGGRDDREEECEDEGAQVEDGHSLGWQNEGSQERLDASHYEPELGSTEEIDQAKRNEIRPGLGGAVHDGEPDLGFVGIGTGHRAGEGQDDREDQCEDEGAQCDDEGVTDSGIADADGLAWLNMAQTEGIGHGKGKDLHNPSLPPERYPDQFCVIADGKCCEPEIADGSYVIVDKRKPYVRGDFVAIFRKPETVRPGDHVIKVKRFFQEFPSGLVVETLNPHRAVYFDNREVWAVWHARPAPEDFVPGSKQTDGALLAEHAKQLANGVVVREIVDRRKKAAPERFELKDSDFDRLPWADKDGRP
jgi:phage repressor protein C with HTH and peptisase S24 domain